MSGENPESQKRLIVKPRSSAAVPGPSVPGAVSRVSPPPRTMAWRSIRPRLEKLHTYDRDEEEKAEPTSPEKILQRWRRLGQHLRYATAVTMMGTVLERWMRVGAAEIEHLPEKRVRPTGPNKGAVAQRPRRDDLVYVGGAPPPPRAFPVGRSLHTPGRDHGR